jgi:hypothetical protein
MEFPFSDCSMSELDSFWQEKTKNYLFNLSAEILAGTVVIPAPFAPRVPNGLLFIPSGTLRRASNVVKPPFRCFAFFILPRSGLLSM